MAELPKDLNPNGLLGFLIMASLSGLQESISFREYNRDQKPNLKEVGHV